MPKPKTSYVCQECGTQYPKWQGKCSACGSWNAIVEEVITQETTTSKTWKNASQRSENPRPVKLNEISYDQEPRTTSNDGELDRVLGGGIVPGSLVLIGGDPGIGKSTLMLQVALQLQSGKILYVSGEESEQQIKMRALRLNNHQNGQQESPKLNEHCYILTATSTHQIFQQIRELQPSLVIIDSIQTLHSRQMESSAGSVAQVRACAAEMMEFAKNTNTPVLLIGHINKEGNLAGPKVLEHMVDTVLQFEGDRHLTYRILRTIKNRFGSTSELGIYEMQDMGLRQVENPSEILISQREDALSGITIGATLEGNRTLLIEIQSLVSPATYGTPQRSSTGFDAKRLNMLLAVLEKRGGLKLGVQDVFLNIAGGLKVEDPAIDLAVCVSIISSYNDRAVSSKTCFAAEVGLGGEIRAVNNIENRVHEAEKLGFESIVISKFNLKAINQKQFKIRIKGIGRLDEVFGELNGS